VIVLLGVILIAAALTATLVARPDLIRTPEGKIFAFLALFVAPGLAVYGGAAAHLERSKTTDFCLSCHIMAPYGKSLHVDDKEYVAAAHFQNNRVPRDHACYTCHTDYALFGGIRSKLRGLRHVIVNYTGTAPDTIRLYHPYNNRECLHCHLGSRTYEEATAHQSDDATLADLRSGKVSCVTSGCHDVVHNVRGLNQVTFWKPKEGQG
jgi:cytochrome c-type protein NapC